jgi:hypothetical protein
VNLPVRAVIEADGSTQGGDKETDGEDGEGGEARSGVDGRIE